MGPILAALLLAGAVAAPATASGQVRVKPVYAADDRFVPRVVNIRQGDAIRWLFLRRNVNVHNVTVMRAPRRAPRRAYNSPRVMRPGSTFARRFVSPGVYTFRCTFHPGMVMRVNVFRR